MYLPAKFGSHRFYRNSDISSYINSFNTYKNNFEKLNSVPRSAILRNFQNQEYQCTIRKARTRMVEEEEHRQWQSVTRFT